MIEPNVVRLPFQHDPPDIDAAFFGNSLHGPKDGNTVLLLDGAFPKYLAAEIVGGEKPASLRPPEDLDDLSLDMARALAQRRNSFFLSVSDII